ncbi:hypothetical protein G6F56_013595 [Rhizopus delemar]|nr:hypothetical protein G6F56_013595 [Rhizopus delemar]
MLSVDICISRDDLGKGSWKANPLLAQNARYRDGLCTHLDNYLHQHSLLQPDSQLSNQHLWDNLKNEACSFTRSFQLDRKSWRMKQIKKQNKKRNRILRDYSNHGILSHLLPVVERQLSRPVMAGIR